MVLNYFDQLFTILPILPLLLLLPGVLTYFDPKFAILPFLLKLRGVPKILESNLAILPFLPILPSITYLTFPNSIIDQATTRSAGRISYLYLKPWPVRLFKDWPFSFYIVAAFKSDEGLVFYFPPSPTFLIFSKS